MKKSIGAKTIIYPTPVFIVGSYDKSGNPNAMTAAWGGICCSSPPCVAVSLRKATCTYANIMEQRGFTVSIPSVDFVEEVDYFGLVSGREVNKFAAVGLTPVKSDLVNAPYVKEFPFALECRLLHTFELGLHTQFVGEILDIKAEESMLAENGLLDIGKVKPIAYAPGDQAYFDIGRLLGKAFSIGKRFETSE
jgi:flavin reductase (DIM6/NTAB) family NADH-FMN oxidoreductase RutF